ncbi:MAG: hypothetical protein Tsb0020_29410 [Haliangiales bacterium]
MAKIQFKVADSLPCYVNNARMEATDDNVFLDFGMADPFELADGDAAVSTTRARLVMNRSTFLTFVQHVEKIRDQLEKQSASELPITIMSRCPPTVDPGG